MGDTITAGPTAGTPPISNGLPLASSGSMSVNEAWNIVAAALPAGDENAIVNHSRDKKTLEALNIVLNDQLGKEHHSKSLDEKTHLLQERLGFTKGRGLDSDFGPATMQACINSGRVQPGQDTPIVQKFVGENKIGAERLRVKYGFDASAFGAKPATLPAEGSGALVEGKPVMSVHAFLAGLETSKAVAGDVPAPVKMAKEIKDQQVTQVVNQFLKDVEKLDDPDAISKLRDQAVAQLGAVPNARAADVRMGEDAVWAASESRRTTVVMANVTAEAGRLGLDDAGSGPGTANARRSEIYGRAEAELNRASTEHRTFTEKRLAGLDGSTLPQEQKDAWKTYYQSALELEEISRSSAKLGLLCTSMLDKAVSDYAKDRPADSKSFLDEQASFFDEHLLKNEKITDKEVRGELVKAFRQSFGTALPALDQALNKSGASTEQQDVPGSP